MSNALANLKIIQEKIARVAERSGRKADSVTLIAVTKTVPLERVQPVLDAGVVDIGENRVQEALAKYEGLRTSLATPPVMHLIGPLQSNKAKKAVGFFDVIQSLDSLDLAKDINRHALDLRKKQTCLIEVKISPEVTKSGVAPERLSEFLDQLRGLPALEVRGLMGIPPLTATGEAARPYFEKLRRLFEDLKKMSPPNAAIGGPSFEKATVGSPLTIRGDDSKGFDVLSMGMSSDFEMAIEEGATMVRIGTALFGER